MSGSVPRPPTPPPEPSGARGSSAPQSTPARAPGSGFVEATDPPTIRSGGSGSGAPRRPGPTALPAPGERLESFELQQSIGAGGMGAVFLALDTRLDRYVALKILPPEQAHDSEVVQRFYQEGRASARLDHENIARVFTIGHDKQYHFIAFEYIEGDTLRQRVDRDGRLPVGEAINYTLQIAGALVHAAERGVVHRDIKPSNIIITPQGRAKLVDMGLARRFERGGNAADDGLTQSGMTLGTFDYISPEQARDPRVVDVRSDLYSLGCTLFHMLTGGPPFPDGTVLQKLLQHQEDAPPDARSLNPDVPADLAAILTKLMAKDRDRRYQSPEQLSRDLLRVAGGMGLRSVGPDGLTWAAVKAPSSWERHLFWGLPAVTLSLVVGALVWWGQEPGAADGPLVVEVAPAPVVPASKSGAARNPVPSVEPKGAAGTPAIREVTAPSPPRQVSVKASEDLTALLESVPTGSTLILTDDGPYRVKPSAKPIRSDLTLKAGPGARPVLRAESGKAPLLEFSGGRVMVEGLEFVADDGEGGDSRAILRAVDADLTLRRCVFRRASATSAPGHVGSPPALDLQASGPGDPTSAIVVDACAFGPGLVGIAGSGPVRLILRDCTFAACNPAVSLKGAVAGKSGSAEASPAHLWLSHVSILAGEGPAFRASGRAPVVRIDDSIVAAGGDTPAILIAMDDPEHLDWRGLRNLYGRVGTFLEPTRDRPDAGVAAPTWDYESWADGPGAPREAGSIPTDARVWAEADPASSLTGKEPARAFRLGTTDRPGPLVGARRGPAGATPDPLAPPALAMNTKDQTPTTPADPVKPPAPMPVPPTVKVDPPAPMSRQDDPEATETAPMAVKADEPPDEPAPMARKEEAPEPVAMNAPRPDDGPRPPRTQPDATPKVEAAPAAVRTAAQFLDALKRAGPKGGTIRLAADADFALPACELRGSGRWTIEAEPGESRPRLRFVPEKSATAPAPAAWLPLFRLRASSLQIQGVDIVLGLDDVPDRGRWAAFLADAGTDLKLTRCTVTIQGEQVRSAVVAVPAAEDAMGVAAAESSAASIRVTDSILRGGGDLFDVASGRKLDLEIEDTALSCGGSLLRGHALPRGQVSGASKVVLRQVTARLAGGLVHLESAPGEPELPVVEVVAWESILATNPEGDPLFRVDGQDALTALRDRIRWEGHSVAYHQIEVYRRDQTAQVGALPLRYDLPTWRESVAPHEADPTHGDVKFARPWAEDRPPWTLTREDVRLAPESPVRPAGADPQDLPVTPRESTP